MAVFSSKCTQNHLSAAGPAGGAYSAPPDPLAGFKGPTSKVGEGREREGRGGPRAGPLHIISGYATENITIR